MKVRRASTLFAITAGLIFHVAQAGAIVGGALDENGHPNAAAWGYYDPDGISVLSQIIGPGPIVLCSGVLVHERVVLTAGHCTAILDDYVGLADERVLFVTFNPDAYAVADYRHVASVSGIETHTENPHSGETRNANDDIDIGALVLTDPVSDITPATLPALNFLESFSRQKLRRASYEVVGYGSTGGRNRKDPALFEIDGLRRVGFPQFLNILNHLLLFQENTKAGNSGHCNLDSGGPTFLIDPSSGDQILIAVTFGGSGLCNATAKQFRLDIQPSIDFIQGVVDGL